jgi:hypothetical protein
MSRRVRERFNQIAPDRGRIIAFLILLAAFEGIMRYVESLDAAIAARLPVRPTHGLLFCAAAAYGIGRVTNFHPACQKDYRAWLETTPWTNRKPLPLGPVELVLEDGLVLAPILLCAALLPHPRAMSILAAFLLSHVGALLVTLWQTRVRAIAYLSTFGLGLAVKLWHQPIECVAMAAVVYLVAYEGLVQALDRFPWTAGQPSEPGPLAALQFASASPGGPPPEPCGWPHDRMLGEVRRAQGIPRLDAMICCALASWWLYVLASFISDEKSRLGMLCLVCQLPYILFPFARIAVYAQGYLPPISPWGRIRTLRWIIPGYDQIFVASLCALVAGPAALGLLFAAGLPLDACVPIGTAVTASVALVAPPRLSRWRLTGEHRIVSGITATNAAFVKVG